MALGGRPDDNAKMVWSRGCIAYLCRGFVEGNAVCIRCCSATFVRTKKTPRVLEGAFSNPGVSPQVFIESKNSELFLVLRSLSSRKSIASIVPIGLRIRRSTYIFFKS